MKKNNKVLFLYGKLANKKKAMLYCDLHKCFLNKRNLFEKKFRCKKCKHKKEIEQTTDR